MTLFWIFRMELIFVHVDVFAVVYFCGIVFSRIVAKPTKFNVHFQSTQTDTISENTLTNRHHWKKITIVKQALRLVPLVPLVRVRMVPIDGRNLLCTMGNTLSLPNEVRLPNGAPMDKTLHPLVPIASLGKLTEVRDGFKNNENINKACSPP